MSEDETAEEENSGSAAAVDVATGGVGCGFEALGCLSGVSVILLLVPLGIYLL